ncbi:GYDIA family GHMP kinase [Myroides injenensis]|uniref:GYDIA family GHMP kinase n=1 Tax=Myroides injenensis TaxID=1183151 RepID=UPI0002889525|nr:GYDIA family GHMP kinase [Myroides injenensis]
MSEKYYSNGKLLISGEYLVLDGALAFALPTKFGQDMTVQTIATPVVKWISYDSNGNKWMQEEIAITNIISDVEIIGSEYLKTLVSVLRTAHKLNGDILSNKDNGFQVECNLSFPRLWGLGTSSTWINNIAQWFKINAFELLEQSFGGSGYDIACAQNNQALFYTRTKDNNPIIETFDFQPSFLNHLYFVYLNQKMDSKIAIANYRTSRGSIEKEKEYISSISKKIASASSLEELQYLMSEHENILSNILKQPTVKNQLFRDFNGAIKSLGGWGGDFVLVACQDDPTTYFKNKGYTTILSYNEMIL